jgi:tetratricopeptide (TPR) repeat protein
MKQVISVIRVAISITLLLTLQVKAQDSLELLRSQLSTQWKEKNWTQAEIVARKIVKTNGATTADFRDLRKLLALQNKATDHLQVALKIAEFSDANSDDLTSICWAMLKQNQPLKASQYCNKAVELMPTDLNALINFGHSYLLIGNIETAQTWYEKAMVQIKAETDYDAIQEDFEFFIGNGWYGNEALAAKQSFGRAKIKQFNSLQPIIFTSGQKTSPKCSKVSFDNQILKHNRIVLCDGTYLPVYVYTSDTGVELSKSYSINVRAYNVRVEGYSHWISDRYVQVNNLNADYNLSFNPSLNFRKLTNNQYTWSNGETVTNAQLSMFALSELAKSSENALHAIKNLRDAYTSLTFLQKRELAGIPDEITELNKIIKEWVLKARNEVRLHFSQLSKLDGVATGMWLEKNSGLIWQKCLLNHYLTENISCPEGNPGHPSAALSWSEAMAYAKLNRMGGFDDWRLPVASELAHLKAISDPNKNVVKLSGDTGAIDGTWPGSVILVRGPTSINYRAYSDNEKNKESINKTIISIEQSETDRKSIVENLKKLTGDKHRSNSLVKMQPLEISAKPYVNGSLKEIDWFVSGLQDIQKQKKDTKAKLLQYVKSKRTFDYKSEFTSPFDKQEFEEKLERSYRNFIDGMFEYRAASLPSVFSSFTPMKIDSYDFKTEVLSVSPCRNLGLYNNLGQNGMRCGGENSLIFERGNLEKDLQAATISDELLKSGRIKFVNFASFFGGGTSGAPLFIVSYGFGSEIKLKVPPQVAKEIFNLAKLTVLPAGYGSDSELKGKMLTIKVVYGAPTFRGFSAQNKSEQSLFFNHHYGASIGYSVLPKSVCIFDGRGIDAVFCQDLK